LFVHALYERSQYQLAAFGGNVDHASSLVRKLQTENGLERIILEI